MRLRQSVFSRILFMMMAIIMTVTLFAGCSSSSEPPAAGQQPAAGTAATTAAPVDNGSGNGNGTVSVTVSVTESPMLASRVSSGALPKMGDRLPEVTLVSKLGSPDAKYGGEMRLAFQGITSSEYGWMNTARVLNQHGMGSTEEMPYANVVEKYTANEDCTVYTFNLRKGLKWSDGQPVTTEDVRFWWEDVMNNKDITPSLDAMWTADGKPMSLKVIDEYTFSCTFESSYLLFPWQLSLAWRSNTMFFLPSHYLKPMHVKYADAAKYKEDLEKAGYSEKDWGKYFTAYGWGPNGPNELTTAKIGCPVLTPYVITEHPSPTVWMAERNPYYFEVDESGRQLPYIDTIRMEQVSDTSMLTMKAMAGEVDYAREAMSTQDVPVLKENESKGDYRAIPLAQHSSVYFNLNFGYDADKGWMEIVNNRKFRQALNYAIDRNEILGNLYLDQGKVSYHTPSELNLDKANGLLDEIGMGRKDSEGFRTRPDGSKFQIDFEYAKLGTEFSDFVEIIRQNWAGVGIRVLPKEIDRSLWTQKYNANQIQVRMLWCDFPVCEGNPVMWDWSIPVRSSTKYQLYYNTSGQSGDAPVGDLLDIFKKTFELKNAKTVSDLNGKWKEVKQLLSDSCIWFVPVEDVVAPVVYSNRMGNVKEDGYMIVSNMDMTYAYIK